MIDDTSKRMNIESTKASMNIESTKESINNDSTKVCMNIESTKENINNECINNDSTKESMNIEEELDKIKCVHCRNYIYVQKDSIKKKLNGINIKCPYSFCNKYFFLSRCPKCEKVNKIPYFIPEGALIECLDKTKCNYKYLQTHCVIGECLDITYFAKPRILNSPNGILYNHKSILLFQKISCHFCYRPIDFITKEAIKINRYFDTMRVTCPYKDCSKSFNRIICVYCSAVNIIEKGTYFMGHKIRCYSCNKTFAKILCPCCLKINPLEKSSFKYGEFECRFANCSKISSIANCLHCMRINYFNLINKSLIQGQTIICGYSDCKKEFSVAYCPSCHELNPFPNGGLILGKLYKCKNTAICSKYFQILVCPQCRSYSRLNDEIEGQKYNCNKCNKLIINFGCPFCDSSILCISPSFIHGQLIKCPSCIRNFSFCRCYQCKRLIYSEENKSIIGKSVICQFCKNYSVNITCMNCRAKISFSDRIDDLTFGEKIKCPNCSTEFDYQKLQKNDKGEMIDLEKEENIYTQNLSVLNKIEGLTINFGKPQVDEHYLNIQNVFNVHKLYNPSTNSQMTDSETEVVNSSEDSSKLKMEEQQKKKLCILCHNDKKESIFFPCGHRYTCYRCAVYYFEVFKICPKCESPAQCIIPKIYNV